MIALLLRLGRSCPRCAEPMNRWIFHWERERWINEHPERPVDLVTCHVCRCNYVVRAKHYQQAQPVNQ